MPKEFVAPRRGTKEFTAAVKRTLRTYDFEIAKHRCLIAADGSFSKLCIRMVRKDDPAEVRYLTCDSDRNHIANVELEAPPRAQHKADIYAQAMCDALGLQFQVPITTLDLRRPVVRIETLEYCPCCNVQAIAHLYVSPLWTRSCGECGYDELMEA